MVGWWASWARVRGLTLARYWMLHPVTFISKVWKCDVDGDIGHLWEQDRQISIGNGKTFGELGRARRLLGYLPLCFLCFYDSVCTEMIIITWFCILFLSCPESHSGFPCLIDTEFSIVPAELRPSGIEIRQPLLPEEFLFSFLSLHLMTQDKEKELLFSPTLQTREARLHRTHSKAGILDPQNVSSVHNHPINPECRTDCRKPLMSLTSAIAIFSLSQSKWVQEWSNSV